MGYRESRPKTDHELRRGGGNVLARRSSEMISVQSKAITNVVREELFGANCWAHRPTQMAVAEYRNRHHIARARSLGDTKLVNALSVIRAHLRFAVQSKSTK